MPLEQSQESSIHQMLLVIIAFLHQKQSQRFHHRRRIGPVQKHQEIPSKKNLLRNTNDAPRLKTQPAHMASPKNKPSKLPQPPVQIHTIIHKHLPSHPPNPSETPSLPHVTSPPHPNHRPSFSQTQPPSPQPPPKKQNPTPHHPAPRTTKLSIPSPPPTSRFPR
jgi:hypothetical protein